jgi:hypothetical protein
LTKVKQAAPAENVGRPVPGKRANPARALPGDGIRQRKEVIMLLDSDMRIPDDTTRVGLERDWEVRYWCARYSVTEQQLRSCVTEVGPRAEDVERKLELAKQIVLKNTGED